MADQLKIVCRPSFDEMYVESESGYMKANLYRSAKMADGGVEVIVGDDCSSLPVHNVTTDEQWRGICDLFAAAPEMVAVLKGAEFVCFDDRTEVREYLDRVKAVLAKAEPPRTAKHTLWVTVKVEIEADTGTSDEVIRRRASESVYTSTSPGVTFKEKQVAGRRELYEE
jgi:hypothetical protein